MPETADDRMAFILKVKAGYTPEDVYVHARIGKGSPTEIITCRASKAVYDALRQDGENLIAIQASQPLQLNE